MSRSLTVVATALLSLCACSPVMLQSSHDTRIPAGVLGTFTYATAGRDAKTVIIGNPFSLSKTEFDKAVTDAMQGHNEGPPTHFTADPSDNVQPGYPIVLMFDPPQSMDSEELCRRTAELQSQPSGQRIRLLAGFCARDNLLSWVSASIPHVDSPNDSAFRDLITETTRNLIPDRDDDQGDGTMDL